MEIRGGDKWEAYLKELGQKVSQPATLRVGFLEGSTNTDGVSIPLIAATNEFGVPSHGQPPRPFMRGWVKDKMGNWGPSLANLLEIHRFDAKEAFKDMGLGMRDQLQQQIRDYVGPPLAPSTVARKGFDKQLIDSSDMLKSVDFDVKP